MLLLKAIVTLKELEWAIQTELDARNIPPGFLYRLHLTTAPLKQGDEPSKVTAIVEVSSLNPSPHATDRCTAKVFYGLDTGNVLSEANDYLKANYDAKISITAVIQTADGQIVYVIIRGPRDRDRHRL